MIPERRVCFSDRVVKRSSGSRCRDLGFWNGPEARNWGSNNDMDKDTWGELRRTLVNTVGPENFVNWIEPIEFLELCDQTAVFLVPTQFMGDWVQRNFGDTILRTLSSAGQSVTRLKFTVCEGTGASAPVSPPRHQPAPLLAVDLDLPGAPLDPNFTFDRFVVGKSNDLAHAAARRVAEGDSTMFNPLFLYGCVGLGKTHLMHAIAHELLAGSAKPKVVYLSAEQFMYRFIQAIRDKRMIDFKKLFRSVDFLMVDDVQFIAGKDSTQEEFFHTFNALVDQRKQIIISADRAPGEIRNLENRIKSRLQSGLVVDVHPTDYELRLGILQQKTERHFSQNGRIAISNGVLEFLAHRITTNVRVLEGALMRLFAFGSLMRREITLDLTQECLADILREASRKVTVDEIQRKVSEHYNIRLADLIGPRRYKTVARPRQIAMYLAKQLTSRSLPEIGRRFGGRDHTTVMHSVRRVEELRNEDSQIAEDIELLQRALES